MILRLTIEQSREPQRRAEMRLADGVLTIGRGQDCDWQLNDPEMFVSRRHCIVTGRAGAYSVTDESTGGLYLDGSDRPLGQGMTVAITHGLRMQMGDIVIRAALEETADATAPAPRQKSDFFADSFFEPQPVAESSPRPAGLPEPFERTAPMPVAEASPAQKPLFDDPFSLDLPANPAAVDLRPNPMPGGNFDFGSFDPPTEPPAEQSPAADDWAGFDLPSLNTPSLVPPPQPVTESTPFEAPPPAPATKSPDDTIDAFLRGLGITPPPGFTGTPVEIEALGRRFRMLAEGLVGLLRARASEKNAARVAQTVIGASDVNPLKFLATTDEALAALMAPRGPGYLPPEAAIIAAFHDLHDHRQRNWSGLQSALRRMVDRFDPARFEAEVEDQGLVKSLVSGSRNARLWQHYTERYSDIAKAAEDRFLGEAGADFRDAYENDRRNGHD